DAVSNVIAGKVSRTVDGGAPYDEWGIVGAKALSPDAIGRMESFPGFRNKYWLYDYEEFVKAEVDGADRVVKLFRGAKGEKAFLKVLKFLQKHREVGPQFQIYGHSAGASTPFIVFHSGALFSFTDFIWYSMSDLHTHHEHMIRVWKSLVEVTEAVEFVAKCSRVDLFTNVPEWPVGRYFREGAMVDKSGSITIDVLDTTTTQAYGGEWPEARSPTSDMVPELAGHLASRLIRVPTCQRLYRALIRTPYTVLSRTAFDVARLNPYEAIRSLPRSRFDPQSDWLLRKEVWHAGQLCDIGVVDHKRTAIAKRPEFRKIGVIDELQVSWQIRLWSTEIFEMTEISDGVYRFVELLLLRVLDHLFIDKTSLTRFALTLGDGELPLRDVEIWFNGSIIRTEGDTHLFTRKAKKLAGEHNVAVEGIYF
ncbi:hypothetical protein FRB99_003909, partial [Tulasnella sp. 403]